MQCAKKMQYKKEVKTQQLQLQLQDKPGKRPWCLSLERCPTTDCSLISCAKFQYRSAAMKVFTFRKFLFHRSDSGLSKASSLWSISCGLTILTGMQLPHVHINTTRTYSVKARHHPGVKHIASKTQVTWQPTVEGMWLIAKSETEKGMDWRNQFAELWKLTVII